MARRDTICLYVPAWLRERLDQHPEVNASELFRTAAVQKLDELDQVEPAA